MKSISSVLLAAVLFFPVLAAGQEPSPSSGSPASNGANGQSSANTGSSSSKTKKREIPSFLIIGTVFNERDLSFPGVQVRIRRSDDRKFRWETYTNSQGEFAVRVPPGYQYEVVIHVKKYKDQNQPVDSKVDVQKRLSIKLEPQDQGQKGGKA
jgi:Carboxypeptidase regulatory-like domain